MKVFSTKLFPTTLVMIALCGFGLASKQPDPALAKEARITMADAEKTALAKAPGKVKTKELEKEKDKLIYSFDIKGKDGKMHEVNVDAITGEMVDDTVENPADEAKEKAMDKQEKKDKKKQQ